MAVDLFGLPADYESIGRIAQQHGLKVIDDAAQSFGATYRNRKVGMLGDVTATSFFPAKPLGCYGDGGAVFTDDDDSRRWSSACAITAPARTATTTCASA